MTGGNGRHQNALLIKWFTKFSLLLTDLNNENIYKPIKKNISKYTNNVKNYVPKAQTIAIVATIVVSGQMPENSMLLI